MVSPKKDFALFLLACLCFLIVASPGNAETAVGMLVMKVEKQGIGSVSGKSNARVAGDITYRMARSERGMIFELHSFSLYSAGVRTQQGDSGIFSFLLKPKSARSTYDPKTRVIKSQFRLESLENASQKYLFNLKESQPKKYNDRSDSETFTGKMICTLSEEPLIGRSTGKMKRETTFIIEMEPRTNDLAKVAAISGKFTVIDADIMPIEDWNRSNTVKMVSQGVLLEILVVGTGLAALVSVLLLWLYRRSVVSTMKMTAGVVESHVLNVPTTTIAGSSILPALTIMDSFRESNAANSSMKTYRKVKKSFTHVVRVYVLGGLAYALVLTFGWMIAVGEGFFLLRFLFLLSCYAWPIVLAFNLIIPAGGVRITIGYFAIFGTIAFMSHILSPDVTAVHILALWLGLNGLSTVLLLAFLNRRVRAVGPLVLAFMLMAVAGSYVITVVIISNGRLLREIIGIVSQIGLGGDAMYMMYIILRLIGCALFGVLGWWLLLWVGRRYRAKRMSDQSIKLDSLWLLFTVVNSMEFVLEGLALSFTVVAAFAAYKFAVSSGFHLLAQKRSEAAGRELLLLRVFSLGRRSQKLLDVLSKVWLRAGSIHLIAGPDLATATVEPHEFLDFVGGRLSRRFVQGEADLEQRLTQLDTRPDPDGRYRVNEFFCRADTWQITMQRLANRSDAVLMDMRSFSNSNQGCIYELSQLINIIPLNRLTLVIDDSTDQTFLEATLQDLWQYLEPSSPNFGLSKPEIRCFPVRKQTSAEMEQLLMTLFSSQHISK